MKHVHPARYVLPTILAWVTGRERYLPDTLEWQTTVLTGNLFRAFELVFWRAVSPDGGAIRAETSVAFEMKDGVIHIERRFFTFEAVIAHIECTARGYLARAFEMRPELGYIPQPVYLTLGILGLKLSLQGDMHGLLAPMIGMAIATDTSNTTHPSASTTATVAITVTATADRVVWGACTANKATVPALSSCTFAGNPTIASTNSPKSLPTDTSLKLFLHRQLAAPSGANNLVFTFATAPDEISAHAVSYSGVTSTPQDTSTNGTGGTETVTMTTTVDNSWLVAISRNNSDGNGTAGASTTRRSNIAGQNAFYDSGGAKSPAGSYSLTITHGSAEYGAIGMSMASSSTTNKTLTATAAATLVLGNKMTLLKSIVATATAVPKLFKGLAKSLVSTATGSVSILKPAAHLKTIVATAVATVSLTKGFVYQKAMQANATAQAYMTAQKVKIVTMAATATATVSLTMTKALSKALVATATATVSVSKVLSLTKSMVAVATAQTSIGMLKAVSITLQAVAQAMPRVAKALSLSMFLTAIGSAITRIGQDYGYLDKYPEQDIEDDYQDKYPLP